MMSMEGKNSGVVEEEIEILNHKENPHDLLQKQFVLAEELYARTYQTENSINIQDREVRNEIMAYWGESGYSAYFRDIFYGDNKAAFVAHPRFQGDPLNITLADLDYYKEHQKLSLE